VTHGLYLVCGTRAYRGHQPGTVFVGRLDLLAEQRAIDRGSIELLERITPTLPELVSLPAGWITDKESNG